MMNNFCNLMGALSIVMFGGLISSSCLGQKERIPFALSRRYAACDTDAVLTVLIRSERLQDPSIRQLSATFYDQSNHTIVKSGHQDLLSKVSYWYNHNVDSVLVLDIIDKWCNTNRFLDDLASSNSELTVEEILYEVPEIRSVLFADGKSWESLSSYELYEGNIKLLNWLDTLSDARRAGVMAELTSATDRLNRH